MASNHIQISNIGRISGEYVNGEAKDSNELMNDEFKKKTMSV